MARMKSAAALAAREIKVRFRDELGVKVIAARSENYAGGSSVHVDIANPRPEVMEAAKRIADEYVYGHFNGMEDIYEYSAVDNGKPKVSFVFVNGHWDGDIMERAKDYAEIKGLVDNVGLNSAAYRMLAKPEFWAAYDHGVRNYDSMLEAVKANDAAAVAEFTAKAKAGDVIRLV